MYIQGRHRRGTRAKARSDPLYGGAAPLPKRRSFFHNQGKTRSCWSSPNWGPSYKGVQQVIIFVPDLLFQWKKEIHMILDIENWLWISINSDLWCQNISKFFLWFTNSIDLVKNFERNWEGRLILRKANLHFLDSLEIPSPNDH